MRSIDRRRFLSEVSRVAIGLTGYTSLVQAALAQTERPSGRRPNFIFFLTDDLGWGDLGCYGHRSIKTPNLDRLAEQGSLYTQFYVSSGVCSPSRTGFMTSHYPARHRVHGHFASHEQNAARGMPNFLDERLPECNGHRRIDGCLVNSRLATRHGDDDFVVRIRCWC